MDFNIVTIDDIRIFAEVKFGTLVEVDYFYFVADGTVDYFSKLKGSSIKLVVYGKEYSVIILESLSNKLICEIDDFDWKESGF